MNVTDSDLAQLTPRHFPSNRFSSLGMLQTQFRFLQKILSRFGQSYRSLGPIQQKNAQLLLQRLDLLSQPGLRDVDKLRSLREMQPLSDRHKIAQVVEIHARSLQSSFSKPER